MRLRRLLGTLGLAMMAVLVCGVAVAQASSQPGIVGIYQDTNTATGNTSGTTSVATQFSVGNWFAYAPSYYSNQLTAINVTNPVSPVFAGKGGPPSPGTQLDGAVTVNIFGGIAYVVSKNENGPCSPACTSNDNGTGNALTLFDVSTNPDVPTYLGSIQDTSDGGGSNGISDGGTSLFGAYGVTVTNIGGTPYALVAAQGCLNGQPCTPINGGNDLAVINVSAPNTPTLTGSVTNAMAGTAGFPNALDHPTAVAVSGNYAYVTSFYGHALTVVDISNPSAPTVVAWYSSLTNLPDPSDVAIQGNYAYVINQNSNGPLAVINISNPLNPTLVTTASAQGLSGGYRIRVSGDFAYVSASNVAAITPVDISNPAAPYVITSVVSTADLNRTTGLDLMNLAGSEYVLGASPYLAPPAQQNYIYPPFPAPGNSTQVNTGTISAIQLDPVTNTPTINPSSEPSTSGQPFTTSTSANFSFTTADAISTVACSLDGSAYTPCTTLTSAQYSGLALGQHTFTVQSTDAAGNNANASYSWTIQAPLPGPVNTALPVVTGSTAVGGTLTTTSGSWSGNPTTFSYQWQRCNAQGGSCVGLHTVGNTYQVGTIDVGDTLRAVVTASNTAGTATATSAATPVVAACGGPGAVPAYCRVPQLKARPQVTGTMKVGQKLVSDPGSWSTLAASAYGGAQLPTLKSQWLRCNSHGSACAAIAGATGAVYRTTGKDLGHTLKLRVVATNRNGSASATSAPSSVIVPASTKLTLAVKFSPGQPLVRHGYVIASVRSTVSAYLDAFFAVQIGNGTVNWTTGTPAQAQAGRYLQFKLTLPPGEAHSLRMALAHHQHLYAAVQGVWVPFPQHPGSVQTREYKFHPKA